MALDSTSRSPNGFLSSLTADDFELIRPYLRTVDLVQDSVLVAVGETLKRAYLPHRGVISLVVNLAKGEHVQIAMIGRDSIFGVFSSLGDPTALNTAAVMRTSHLPSIWSNSSAACMQLKSTGDEQSAASSGPASEHLKHELNDRYE